MSEIKGTKKPELHELPQIKDRMSFLYLEKCKISRESNAIQVWDKTGSVLIPSAQISVLLLGPGTTITHRAVELIDDCGISVVWMGEGGVRFYAAGRPLTSSSRLLMRQAEYVSNQRKHLEVARKMYALRFPDEDLTGMTLQQMRGKEGIRMKKLYADLAEEYGIPWEGRNYDPENFSSGDPVNQGLSSANACLYGLVQSIICSLGLSPGLGFIHVGHTYSFVYDVADLYKAEITIPLAFRLAKENPTGIARTIRKELRTVMFQQKLIERIVKDLLSFFQTEGEDLLVPEIALWNGTRPFLKGGTMYGE